MNAQITNPEMREFSFVESMYADGWFPDHCVQKVEEVLVALCLRIEEETPESLEELYRLTHAATEEINELQDYFFEQGSEIETGAREAIAMDFERIAIAYGFDADVEELIAPRDW